ncbi:MAG: hypothetical protein WC514_03165, partial [Candidatus Paceibacterota bacterium]
MPELSQSTQKLIQKYQSWHNSLQPKEGVSTIHVDEVASKVATFYEKLRGVVDWREEHLMRRATIERILKRRLLLQKNGEDLASPFISELIRSGYFPNDKIDESRVSTVQNLLEKYLFIIQNSPSPPVEKIKAQLYDWLMSIAACEVEEILDPPRRERALIEYMEDIMQERISVEGINESEKNTQISIAVQESLFKLDKPIINYHLLKKQYGDWLQLSQPRLEEITGNIYSIWRNIENSLHNPLSKKFYQICERYDTPYLILGDVLSEEPLKIDEKIKSGEFLENKIRQAYQARLGTLKKRLSRAAIYSTVSIFLTKMLLAFAIEIPFDRYVVNQFNPLAMALSIIIPPLLMFIIVLTIRPPESDNLNAVIMETMKIAYTHEGSDAYKIKKPKKRGFVMATIITSFYFLSFCLSFGLIIWGLEKLNFGILSIIIFLIFVSLISFAGVKIRERSRELDVTEEKEGFLGLIIDLFSMPIIQVGKWLSGQWAKYNVILVLMTAI